MASVAGVGARPVPSRLLLLLPLVVALGAALLVLRLSGSPAPAPPQLGWTGPGAAPLSDSKAAAEVTRHPETVSQNRPYNDYVPTDAQLRTFHAAVLRDGEPAEAAIPELRYVTGRPGLRSPSTDDLIQWAAHKWGIPEDWMRADMAVETQWRQSSLGDPASVAPAWLALYPSQARLPGTDEVYQSMGIAQVKWKPDGSVDPGSEPLRHESTAFALDYYAATVRYFYDGHCGWCGPGYTAGQTWNSIGAWYQPRPWGNAGQQGYIGRVREALTKRVWTQSGF
jgi:hypothetical protein